MARQKLTALFVPTPLGVGAAVALEAVQNNYLGNVLA